MTEIFYNVVSEYSVTFNLRIISQVSAQTQVYFLFSGYHGFPEPTGLFTIVHLVSFMANIKFRLNFLIKVDCQFPLSPHPDYP